MKYPHVLSEEQTLDNVIRGASIGRYGDGEMNIARGGNCVSQVRDPGLAQELKLILGGTINKHATNFIVGIPNLDARSPKILNWKKQAGYFEELVVERPPKHFIYGSSFITRPDSAPWIDTKEYFDAVESLWRGQNVILVGNGKRSLTKEFLEETGARGVAWVECPYRDAYASAGSLYLQILNLSRHASIKRVLLCCGPTATILADKLAGAGLHAIDLGHIGMFWRRYADPHHPIMKHVEQREINKATGKVEPNS